MATDPVLPVGLEALPAKWRKRADEKRPGGVLFKHSERMITTLRSCADELEAVLSAEPRQQRKWKATKDWCAACDWNHDPALGCLEAAQQDKAMREATEPRPPADLWQRIYDAAANEGSILHDDTVTAIANALEGSRPPAAAVDRLMLLARFGARIAHENLFDVTVNMDGDPTEGHEDHGGSSWGFDTCPHGDCVMVRAALAAPREQNGWQPIESCPKDMTWFLAWDYDGGFYTFRDGPGLIASEHPSPTHWMPLPAAPREDQ